MHLKRLLLLFLISNSLFAQRSLVYPIILVHGWTGSADKTWGNFTNYLEGGSANLSIERDYLNYNLNYDNNVSKSNISSMGISGYDIAEYIDPRYIGNHDVYFINFDYGNTQSNQSAAVKQGLALKFAIGSVLSATKADKVVLLGHSMGGLAIREYIQNHTQNDGQHHVAKIATIGTPHGGSNLGSGNLLNFYGEKDEASEAVRDLRTSYLLGGNGVYLFGGYENSSTINRGLLSQYHNIDVNCNGRIGDLIIGLNQKGFPSDIDVSCVIGGPTLGDGAVNVESQNLNNFYSNLAETFNYNCNSDPLCHKNETVKGFFEMLQALDEPKKHRPIVQLGIQYKGFFTTQSNGSNVDTDEYSFFVPQSGTVTISAGTPISANGIMTIKDINGVTLFSQSIGSKSIQLPNGGTYSISLTGNSNGGWATYSFSVAFCPTPPIPTISALSATTFCEGQEVKLSATFGYDEYKWFKDGMKLLDNTLQITANKSGLFTVQAIKCGITNLATNSISVIVKPIPPKPTIVKDDQLDKFLLTSSSSDNNQWFLNGKTINGATNQTFIPQELGNYTVTVTKEICAFTSDISVVKMDKPTLTLTGTNPFCDGDSVKIVALSGFGSYVFSNGIEEITRDKNAFIIKKAGNYSVITKRGKFISPQSDLVTIKVIPKPSKPTIAKEEQLDKFLLTSSSTENNQWFLNEKLITGATAQTFIPQELGNYAVRITKDGCFNLSDISVVKMDKPILTLIGSKSFCDGDSAKLVAPSGFGAYVFSNGVEETTKDKNELNVKKTGTYSVATKRGIFKSLPSEPIVVTAYPIPAKPTITVENFGLKSSSATNNQWSVDGVILKDSTGQYLRGIGSGLYSVRVIENGCSSEKDVFIITGTEANKNSFTIKLYPNPNEGTFWVEVPESLKSWQIGIFDALGKNIFSKLHKNSTSNKEQINIKAIIGSYILRVTTNNLSQSIKFMID